MLCTARGVNVNDVGWYKIILTLSCKGPVGVVSKTSKITSIRYLKLKALLGSKSPIVSAIECSRIRIP